MEKLKRRLEELKYYIDLEIDKFFEEHRKKIPKNSLIEEAFDEAKRFSLLPGKRARPILVILGYEGIAKKRFDETVLRIAISYELLHAYLLVHDDVMDKAELRRKNISTWKYYEQIYKDTHAGYSGAIIVGDILNSLSTQVILESNIPKEIKVKILKKREEINELTAYGQILDVFLPFKRIENAKIEDTYLIHELKTANYTFVGPLITGGILAGKDEKELEFYKEYGLKLGLAFQIRDDYLDLFGDPSKTGKIVGGDIKEGKITPFVKLTYERANENDKKIIKEILLKKEKCTEEDINTIIALIEKYKVKEEMIRKMDELAEECKKVISESPIWEETKETLISLADYIVKRLH